MRYISQFLALTIVALMAACVSANLVITSPYDETTFLANSAPTITWGDSSDEPTAKEIGKCSVQLCYRIDWDIIVVQELATHIDASRLSVQSAAIDGSLASDGDSYFIRIISDTLLDDSLDYKPPYAVYSGNFTLKGMSGKLPSLDTTTSVPTISASSSTTHSAVLKIEITASQSGASTDSSSTEVATSSTQSNNTASAATSTTHSAAVLPITTSTCSEVHTTTGSIVGTDQVSTASNRNSASGCSSLVATNTLTGFVPSAVANASGSIVVAGTLPTANCTICLNSGVLYSATPSKLLSMAIALMAVGATYTLVI